MRAPLTVLSVAGLLFVALVKLDAQAQGFVRGRVTDPSEMPIADAEVSIAAIDAKTRSDSSGMFHIRALPAGVHRLEIRKVGFTPASMDVRVGNDSTTVHVRLVRIRVLPAVPVEGVKPSASNYRLRDFDRRRSSGVGQFLTAEDLEPERSRPLGDVLIRLRGTQVIRSGHAACLATRRGAESVHNSATGTCGNQWLGAGICPVAVFVNAYPVYTGQGEEIFNLSSFTANEVIGVEFYSGSSTIPREFSAPRGTCGALVIWTRA